MHTPLCPARIRDFATDIMSHTIPFRTGDQTLVREINLSLIMNRLLEHASLSRAGLAEVTGLNKSTVSSLVQELLDLHFVREVGLSSSGIGRPSMQIAINPQAGCIVSCEIGVDAIAALSANFGAETIWERRESRTRVTREDAFIEQVLTLITQAIDASERNGLGTLLGLAVGVPGLVSTANGTILFAPNLGWQNVPLEQILRQRFAKIPIFVENEANMAALGEYFLGAAQGFREVIYLSTGVGLGGAVVRQGRVVKGAAGFASEFGHMTMDPNGAVCACGNRGCWETQVSQSRVFTLVRDAIAHGQPSTLSDATDGDWSQLTIEMIAAAARRGDPAARTALETVGVNLGTGIASLVNAFNPDLVVLGGALSAAADVLVPVIEDVITRRALHWNRRAVQIVQAQHGANTCLMGGIAMVYQSILSKPTHHGRANTLS